MRNITTYLFCFLLVFAPACAYLSPQQKEAGKTAVQGAYERGEITAEQRDDAIEALETGSGEGLEKWLYLGGSVLASILTGVPIAVGVVQKKRGPTEVQRQAMKAKSQA